MAPARGTRRSNEEWLDALRAPDTPEGNAAQAELRALVEGALRRAVASHARVDGATFDDLAQVAVLQILEKLDRFEGRSRFTTWAYSVAVRAAFTELRRASYREGLLEDGVAPEVVDGSGEPGARSERDEIVAVLHRVIDRDLTERQRIAVQGELRGTPQEELLAELGINRNALYKLLYDARRKLHTALCAAGICDDEVREAFGL